MLLFLVAQVEEPDGFALPENAGSALVWVIFLGVIAGLWMVMNRTRRRAEEEYWRRRQDDQK